MKTTTESSAVFVRIFACLAGAAAIASAWASSVHAGSVEEFYKDKRIHLYIGFSVGGGYDAYARLLARHMSRHIPGNPTIVPSNMPGAGSLRLANWLYDQAPRDGTAFGTISRGIPFQPLLGDRDVTQFEASEFTWIGSANDEVSTCVAWHDTGITSFADLYTTELILGSSGAGADSDQFPRVMNGVLGTRFKMVSGYPGGNEINLAIERGEVGGRCGWSWSSTKATHQRWLDNRKVNILVQLALHKHPDLPDVPLIMDLAKTDEERRIFKLVFARQALGRPFLAPPDLPPDRARALRKAFDAAMQDPAFLAEAEKSQMEINPISGDAVQELIADIYATPAEVVRKTRTLLEESATR